MARKNHGKPDPLQIQVAIKIRHKKGARIHPRVLQQIIERAVNGEELPPGVEFNGIYWRNPARRGTAAYWRYHEGANLDKPPVTKRYGNHYIDGVPLEDTPRGSLSEAAGTLGGALFSGVVTF